MSEYVEKCPCCNNHSLEVTQHDWGEERRCELCGFAVAPSLPTQAHVGNAVAFVSAACSWFDGKNLDMPLDERLAETVRSGAEVLKFAGERKVSRDEAERLAEEFQAEVIDKFYVREEEDDRGRLGLEGSGVLLSFAGQKHLLTAAHVLDARTKLGKRLCVLPDDLTEQPVPLEGFEAIVTALREREDRMDEPHDFAILPLPPRVESSIRKRPPITPGEILIPSRPIAPNVFGIVGYPGAPNKVDVKHRRIRPAPQLYTLKRAQPAAYECVKRHPAINIVFTMDVEAMKDDHGNVVRAPHPKGVSGGGVWQVVVPAERDELTFCPKLVGVFIEWYKQHKLACCTKILHVLKAAATKISGAREELEREGFALD